MCYTKNSASQGASIRRRTLLGAVFASLAFFYEVASSPNLSSSERKASSLLECFPERRKILCIYTQNLPSSFFSAAKIKTVRGKSKHKSTVLFRKCGILSRNTTIYTKIPATESITLDCSQICAILALIRKPLNVRREAFPDFFSCDLAAVLYAFRYDFARSYSRFCAL